jgi:hypothetical protein
MIKRMVLLSAALILSLAFAAPSRADMTYQLTGSFAVTGGTATDVEMLLTPTSATLSVDSLTGSLPSGATASATTINFFGTNYPAVELDFSPTASGNYVVTFTSPDVVHLQSYFLTGLSGSVTASNINVALTTVPEPSSIALLGIGLSGFIAFRRRFSRKLPVS